MSMYLSLEGRTKAVNGEQQADDDDCYDDVLMTWVVAIVRIGTMIRFEQKWH